MDLSIASWVVIVAALAAANLPFFNERLFGLFALPARVENKLGAKPFLVRLIELLVLYVALGAVAFALEAKLGNPFPQRWEFYAITACLFVVLAFPGFVLRYLRRSRPR